MQLPSPTLSLEVKGVLKGIHRKSDGRQRQAPALQLHHLRQLLKALDLDAPRDLRDASMFLSVLLRGVFAQARSSRSTERISNGVMAVS